MIVETDKSQDLLGKLQAQNRSCSSYLKASRLKIQKETMFQFKSKVRKRLMSSSISQATNILSYSDFLFYSGLQLIG